MLVVPEDFSQFKSSDLDVNNLASVVNFSSRQIRGQLFLAVGQGLD